MNKYQQQDYNLDYFEYKKNKTQSQITKQRIENKNVKFNYFLKLFFITFIIIFIILVIVIMKFTSKMDIEYQRGDITPFGGNTNSVNGENQDTFFDEEQKRIDTRLSLIQQEENAPSEAKILNKEKQIDEIIDPIHLKENEKLEKEKKLQEKKENNRKELLNSKQEENAALNNSKDTNSQADASKNKAPNILEKKPVEQNITIVSKVVVGKYYTFEDAKSMQNIIKEKHPQTTPFVRKIGDIYTVQMGSYQEFSVAQRMARELKVMGLDVWIYQQ